MSRRRIFLMLWICILNSILFSADQEKTSGTLTPDKTSLTGETRIAEGYAFGRIKSIETKKVPNPNLLIKPNQEAELTVYTLNLLLDNGQSKNVGFAEGLFINDGKPMNTPMNITADTEIALSNNGKLYLGNDAYKLRQQQKSRDSSNMPVLPMAVIGKVEKVNKSENGSKFLLRFDNGRKIEYVFGSLEIIKNGKPVQGIKEITPGGDAIVITENGKDKLYLGSDALRLIRVYSLYKRTQSK